MDLPKSPEDPELKNIIDKLANFVARNGPEFEQMTKQKQKDNPKFSFLFSGDYFNYYQYRVTTEQAIIKQQQQKIAQQQAMVQQVITQQAIRTAPWQQPQQQPAAPALMPSTQILQEQLEQQRQAAQEQIRQSETNLAAQYQSIMQQQQVMIDEAIMLAKKESLISLSSECEIPLDDLHKMVQPIIDSCTKDAISNGKGWIFSHYTSSKHGELLAYYLLERITDKEASFELRLHLIYLINDILHHCVRKNLEELRQQLETIVVVPAFCIAHTGAEDDGKNKLTKLLNLWESNSYFNQSTIESMKDPATGLSNYQASLITNQAEVVTRISTDMNAHFLALQKQHQDFVAHLNNQIAALEQQAIIQANTNPTLIGSVGNQINQITLGSVAPMISQTGHGGQMTMPGSATVQTLASTHGGPPPPPQQMSTGAGPHGFPPPAFGPPLPHHTYNQPPPGFGPSIPPQQFDYGHGQGPPIINEFGGLPPLPGGPMPAIHLPDLSKPPPGFPPGMNFQPGPPQLLPPPPTDADLMPSMPYYDLPAGLMAPLVKLEDCEYKPLDPRDIRLPPPMPPTDRLLSAVEAFYSAPSHERPRDSDGWEKLGLFEFFKAKQKTKKSKNENDVAQQRRRSRSPSPKRRRNNRGRSRSPVEYLRSSRSLSRSRSKSGSRSRSRSKSRSRSRSPPPPPRRRSRERSRTPPTFYSEPYYQQSRESRLGEENKGHQLLMKMGWSGGALGNTGDGIIEPIEHADVRDRVDMYKGLGMSMNDPFEQFRKNKSFGFTTRMREKAEAAEARAAAHAGKSSSPPP